MTTVAPHTQGTACDMIVLICTRNNSYNFLVRVMVDFVGLNQSFTTWKEYFLPM